MWQALPRNLNRRVANDFSGGINTENSPFSLKDNESMEEYGWDTDQHPSLATRRGRTTIGSSGSAVTYLLTNYGNVELIRAVGTILQRYTGGAWSNIGTGFTAADWNAANFDIAGPVVILVNGVDAVRYWNGTTLTSIVGAPLGKYIAADNRRVYIAVDDVVHFCKFQDATDWSGDGSGEVQYYTANGGDITALYAFEGQIWVFKKDAYALIFHTGDSRITHRLVEQSNNVGCVSFKTVVEVGSYLFWLGQNDVYMGAGGASRSIGNPIRSYLESINPSHISKCFGWTDGIRYYLALVTGNNTEPDTELVYDPRSDHQKWRVRNVSLGGLRYGAFLNNVAYAGDFTGQSYRLNSGTADNGTAIPWSWTSKMFDVGAPEAEKELYEMHVQGYFPSGTTLTVEIATDDKTGTFYEINYDPASSSADTQNKNLIIPLDTVPLANFYRYRLSGSGYAEIYQAQVYSRIQPVQY